MGMAQVLCVLLAIFAFVGCGDSADETSRDEYERLDPLLTRAEVASGFQRDSLAASIEAESQSVGSRCQRRLREVILMLEGSEPLTSRGRLRQLMKSNAANIACMNESFGR